MYEVCKIVFLFCWFGKVEQHVAAELSFATNRIKYIHVCFYVATLHLEKVKTRHHEHLITLFLLPRIASEKQSWIAD